MALTCMLRPQNLHERAEIPGILPLTWKLPRMLLRILPALPEDKFVPVRWMTTQALHQSLVAKQSRAASCPSLSLLALEFALRVLHLFACAYKQLWIFFLASISNQKRFTIQALALAAICNHFNTSGLVCLGYTFECSSRLSQPVLHGSMVSHRLLFKVPRAFGLSFAFVGAYFGEHKGARTLVYSHACNVETQRVAWLHH
eukprot:3498651-Amphidinium_carterae.1